MTETGPIAILSAIPQESTRLAEDLEAGVASRPGNHTIRSGTLDGVEVILAEAGIGKVNTAIAATLLVERYGARLIVFTGVAGGLDPGLAVGDVVVAEKTIQHDTGLLEDGGLSRYQPGHIVFFNPTDDFGYSPPSDLLARVRSRLDGFTLPALSPEAGGGSRGPRVLFGTVLTGDQFINSETHRERLRAELAGSAVEMEGAALAQTAITLGVGHLVIRSLSDLAGSDSIEDFSRFLDEVTANSARVVRHLLPVL